MTLRQIADRFDVDRSVARRWLLKEGYEFVEVRDRERGNQMVAALPINVAADALHHRKDQGFLVFGLKREKRKIITEDELKADAVLRHAVSTEGRRRAIERGEWVDEVSGFILEEKEPTTFTEAADYVTDVERLVSEIIEHSDGRGNTFDLIDQLRTMVEDSRNLNSDVMNMVPIALQRLAEQWREQAQEYRARSSDRNSAE